MRVKTDGVAVGYTGDTGPVDGLAEFMSGVDVLIAECSFPDPPAIDTHLTPSGLGALASAALPGQLLVSHVYPGLSSDAILAGIRAVGFDGPVVIAQDGTSVRLA